MNKRIENLFEQALDAAVSETWTTLNPVQLMRLRDKFAELIVRECIDTVKKDSVVTLEDKIGLILSIKEQFGVKL